MLRLSQLTVAMRNVPDLSAGVSCAFEEVTENEAILLPSGELRCPSPSLQELQTLTRGHGQWLGLLGVGALSVPSWLTAPPWACHRGHTHCASAAAFQGDRREVCRGRLCLLQLQRPSVVSTVPPDLCPHVFLSLAMSHRPWMGPGTFFLWFPMCPIGGVLRGAGPVFSVVSEASPPQVHVLRRQPLPLPLV